MAGYNKLRFLPGSIKRLRLDSLDLAPNSFESTNVRNVNNLGVFSLLECAARKVIKCRSVLIALAFGLGHFTNQKDDTMQSLISLTRGDLFSSAETIRVTPTQCTACISTCMDPCYCASLG